MELSFCDLRAKEVINICDGKRLGNIIDLIFDSCTACVIGIVVPSEKGFFTFFKSNQDIFIPYNRIRKIGKDVILVELNPTVTSSSIQNSNTQPPQSHINALEINSIQNENNCNRGYENDYDFTPTNN